MSDLITKIETKEQHEAALALAERLIDLNATESLLILADMIEEYERKILGNDNWNLHNNHGKNPGT